MVNFLYIVILFSLIYIILTRLVQKKLFDKKKIKEFQNKMNELNKKFKEAVKRNDKDEMDKLSKEQMKLMPKMKGVMFEQLKMTFLILITFFTFIYVLDQIDPLKKDDITLNFTKINDSIWQTSFYINGKTASINIEFKDIDKNKNKINLFVSTKYEMNNFTVKKSIFYTDKKKYNEGDKVKLYAINVKEIDKAIYDNGTALNLDLPFNILGIRFIYGTYGIFIVSSIILGWILTPLVDKL